MRNNGPNCPAHSRRHRSLLPPFPAPGGQGEEKQSQYPCQLFIERQEEGREGERWGEAESLPAGGGLRTLPGWPAPKPPTLPYPDSLRLRGDGRGMSLGPLSPAVLELPLVVGNRDAASGWGDGPVPSEGTFVAV